MNELWRPRAGMLTRTFCVNKFKLSYSIRQLHQIVFFTANKKLIRKRLVLHLLIGYCQNGTETNGYRPTSEDHAVNQPSTNMQSMTLQPSKKYCLILAHRELIPLTSPSQTQSWSLTTIHTPFPRY